MRPLEHYATNASAQTGLDDFGDDDWREGLEPQPQTEERMRSFLATNPQDEHGTHTYTFEDTGLDAGALRERASRYQDYFGVESEF